MDKRAENKIHINFNRYFDINIWNKIRSAVKLENKHMKRHPKDAQSAAILGALNAAMLLQGYRIRHLVHINQKAQKQNSNAKSK